MNKNNNNNNSSQLIRNCISQTGHACRVLYLTFPEAWETKIASSTLLVTWYSANISHSYFNFDFFHEYFPLNVTRVEKSFLLK